MSKTAVRRIVLAALVWSALGENGRDAGAYPQYSQNGDATYCRACHGDFRATSYFSLADGADWGVDLHILHRDTMLGGDCDTCHSSGGRFPVRINSSKGGDGLAAISCMGCHGREEDNTDANPAFPTLGGRGAGLRQHHQNAGIALCAVCHEDANPSNYTPVGEDVAPLYYAAPGSGHPAMPLDSCNADGSEDLAGQPTGLDNDGDGSYDGADSDCPAEVDAGTPDASAGTPDASAGTPDASPGTPDASFGVPDASAADASFGVPDAMASDGSTGAPDAGEIDAGVTPDARAVSADAEVAGTDGDAGGCACRAAGEGTGAPPPTAALVFLAVILAVRRRA